jgi:hypothetical protein
MASAGRWISVTVGGAEHETVHTGPLARAVPRQRRDPSRLIAREGIFKATDADLAKRKAAELAALKLGPRGIHPRRII